MVMTEVRCTQLTTLSVNNLSMSFTGWVLHPSCVWLTLQQSSRMWLLSIILCTMHNSEIPVQVWLGTAPGSRLLHATSAGESMPAVSHQTSWLLEPPAHTHTIATYMFGHVRKTTCTPHHQHHAPLSCPDEHISHSTHTYSQQGACGHHMACPQW